MREFFELYKPKAETAALLRQIIAIVDDYAAQGFVLTLRQLYYQLVSRDFVPNTEKSYKRVGDIVSKARRAGFLDWHALEDRARKPQSPPEWANLDELVDAALRSYRLPRLRGQQTYVELWVEKDALAGVLHPIANRHHVTLMVNRGYSSTSAMKAAGERLRTECKTLGIERAHVLYLGDLDPSGEDMVRDVYARLDEYVNSGTIFTFNNEGKTEIEDDDVRKARLFPIDVKVTKLALTMEQVEEYDPPPNPAKMTDSRAAAFVDRYGSSSWEVDALPPRVLHEIIENALSTLIDEDKVAVVRAEEENDKQRLRKALSALRRTT